MADAILPPLEPAAGDEEDFRLPEVSLPPPKTGEVIETTFPADEVVWGIAIRNGFDEIDDPLYHKGVTQHAYLEGSDSAAICGFRPPQSGPRTRRRSRLGLPSAGDHPMCGMCARMVVAPRPRVPVPIQPSRPPVAVPVSRGSQPVAVSVAPATAVPAGAAGSPWPAVHLQRRQLHDVDDGGADEDVEVAGFEGVHDGVAFRRGKAAVQQPDAIIGERSVADFFKDRLDRRDVFDDQDRITEVLLPVRSTMARHRDVADRPRSPGRTTA